jgi:cytochrome c biogenesis protein
VTDVGLDATVPARAVDGVEQTTGPIPRDSPTGPPRGLGVRGWARWAWRTLTSMRTALLLLFLLALAAVPGSLLPQRGTSPGDVAGFRRENPALAPWLDRLGLFEVYSAPWFAAIYLLLLTSLTGCVLPRCLRLWKAARAQPGPAPRNLTRLAGSHHLRTSRPPLDVLEAAAAELRRRRFRIRVDTDAVSAEKGYLREAGNLIFHLSLLVLLFGVAAGQLYGFEGRVIVVEGAGFANTRTAYDDFTPGPWADSGELEPFSFTLTDFSTTYETTGPQRGTPRDFTAGIEYRPSPGSPPRRQDIKVNHPLTVDGTKVFLTGNGYAPRLTVRDGQDRVVSTGPVVFLPLDGAFTSEGVVKAPDAGPEQLGFEGYFLPTAAIGPQGPYSAFPDVLNPQVLLTAYTGNLGLSSGVPQSVFELDKSGLTQVTVEGEPLAEALSVGQTMTLPDGGGSITFDGVSRFANFQIAHDPGKGVSLAAGILLLVGLLASLSVRQRRVYVRVRPNGAAGAGGTDVEVAGLSRTRLGAPPDELAHIAEALADRPDVTEAPGKQRMTPEEK